jgi:hypothetical protein
MASKSNLVNLDALIKRADFGLESSENQEIEKTSSIGLRDLMENSLMVPNLRKPDFQRETNHWGPEQVVSFLESFVNGDVVPSVILWKSSTYIFVIDGGHRWSALRAWIEDDYGDNVISYDYFGRQISKEQKRTAEKTRNLIDNSVGSFKELQAKNIDNNLSPELRSKVSKTILRALQIQWINGNAQAAERSFFKINTQGTPLDSIEELLLSNRKKPIPIASRAVIRAGTGHKYWSQFEQEIAVEIVEKSKKMHSVLFEPELTNPIKTLELPLGGPKGIRSALQTLMDFMLIANKNQAGNPSKIQDYLDDATGSGTVEVLRKSLKVANRITGNDISSLGLHPAVYFYGPSGRHSNAMFMGLVSLFSKKIIDNDNQFFKNFTSARGKLEQLLIDQKDLIASILQKHISKNRIPVFVELIDDLVKEINLGNTIDDKKIIQLTKLEGRIVLGDTPSSSTNNNFNDDIKSQSFIKTALTTAIRCPLCDGYIDAEKSLSYDHIQGKKDGCAGTAENCQLTHPYCNSIKN